MQYSIGVCGRQQFGAKIFVHQPPRQAGDQPEMLIAPGGGNRDQQDGLHRRRLFPPPAHGPTRAQEGNGCGAHGGRLAVGQGEAETHVGGRCRFAFPDGFLQRECVLHAAAQLQEVAEFLDGLTGAAARGVQADRFGGDDLHGLAATIEFFQQRGHLRGLGATQDTVQQGAAGAAVQPGDAFLDRGDRGRGHAQFVESEADEQRQVFGISRHFAADAQPAFCLAGLASRLGQQAQEGRVQRVKKLIQSGVAAVHGQELLQQVVAADTEEIGFAAQVVE